jgi:uncharacterized protein with HEPN domain
VSPRSWQDRIRDILDAIAEIQQFTRGMDYESFKEDDKSIRAVEMNFIIIGEAANQIPEEIEEKHTAIPWTLSAPCGIALCMSILKLMKNSCGIPSKMTYLP